MRMIRSTTTCVLIALAGASQAVSVYGLSTRNQLVSFDSATPGNLMMARFIQGVSANEAVINIDFRPATGQLYALGSFGNLYTLNTLTAQATLVAALTNSSGGGALQLNGVEFGFDFNPTVDRIRVVSDLGDNWRVNPTTGSTIVDGSVNGPATHIVGSAYTNNDSDPNTATTLYNLDSMTNVLTMQNPANSGTQVVVGPLGLDFTALAGFDILTTGSTNTAYAALEVNGASNGSTFGTVDLTTGVFSNIGAIGMAQSDNSLAIRDIAVVPEPATLLVVGLGLAALARRRKSA